MEIFGKQINVNISQGPKAQAKKEEKYREAAFEVINVLQQGKQYLNNLLDTPAQITTAPSPVSGSNLTMHMVGNVHYSAPVVSEDFQTSFKVCVETEAGSGLNSLSARTEAAYQDVSSQVNAQLTSAKDQKDYIGTLITTAQSALTAGTPNEYHNAIEALRTNGLNVTHGLSAMIGQIADAFVNDISTIAGAQAGLQSGQGNSGYAAQIISEKNDYVARVGKAMKSFVKTEKRLGSNPLFDLEKPADTMVGAQKGPNGQLEVTSKYQLK